MSRFAFLVIVCALLAIAPVYAWLQQRSPPPLTSRAALEARYAATGLHLLRLDGDLPATEALRRVSLRVETLAQYEIYLAPPAAAAPADAYLRINAAGAVSWCGQVVDHVRAQVDWLESRDGQRLLLDGRPWTPPGAGTASLQGWTFYWATTQASAPALAITRYPAARISDSFMRTELGDGVWQQTAGHWRLMQHGGGMPTGEAELENAGFQRAVNPFTVLGHGKGLLTYAGGDWAHGRVEARFHFGRPRLDRLVDRDHLPVDTDMLVVIGPADGRQVAFGWQGAYGDFALLERPAPDADWTRLAAYSDSRPPVTNWVRIGLELRQGSQVVGYLDGQEVATAPLETFLAGPLHIACGSGLMEFDDVRGWSLPLSADAGEPIYVRSRQFAGKHVKNRADPAEFGHWAQSDNTWKPLLDRIPGGALAAGIRTRQPLFGAFAYTSIPEHADAGVLPPGLYEYRLLQPAVDRPLDVNAGDVVWRLRLQRHADGWSPADPAAADPADAAADAGLPALATPAWPADHRAFALQFRRPDSPDARLELRVQDAWQPVSAPLVGPLRLEIRRIARDVVPAAPEPVHHAVTSTHLVNEFFEDAPSAWSWVDGAFRMDSRWACQDQWNFMACSAVAIPYATSKRRYFGDQEHEFFMSLRPNYPWDIGDTSFTYDPKTDHGFEIFKKHAGWYTRRDLNFAFCSDGRNPLSGYALIFAGYDNTRTVLMRRGEIVASAPTLIDKSQNHAVIHWDWWNFRVARYGGRILITYNGDALIDYLDPEPLDGGHIGFWSVRNGFTLSRVTSIAERLDSRPFALYVPSDSPSDWRPVLRDGVALSHADGPAHTRVTFNTGAGFQGVRQDLAAPVDLAATPRLELPLRLGDDTRVNLHLQVDGRPYLLQMNAPLTEIRSFLTPSHDAGEQFQLPAISEAEIRGRYLLGSALPAADGVLRVDLLAALRSLGVSSAQPRLQSLAVGNTSNADYLLAGRGANQAGASYAIGSPRFLEPAP